MENIRYFHRANPNGAAEERDGEYTLEKRERSPMQLVAKPTKAMVDGEGRRTAASVA